MPPRRPPSPASGTPAPKAPGAPAQKASPPPRAPAQQPAAKATRGTSTTAAARPPAGTASKKVAKAAAAKRPSRNTPRKPAGRPAGSTRPRAGTAGRAGESAAALRAGAGRPVWVLAGVAVLLAVLILPYVQKWVVQRNDIAASRAEVEQTRRDVTDLREEQARWKDPDFVKAQARERLHFVLPGETAYVVVDGKPEESGPSDPGSRAARAAAGSDRPWFGNLWESVEAAGRTPSG